MCIVCVCIYAVCVLYSMLKKEKLKYIRVLNECIEWMNEWMDECNRLGGGTNMSLFVCVNMWNLFFVHNILVYLFLV